MFVCWCSNWYIFFFILLFSILTRCLIGRVVNNPIQSMRSNNPTRTTNTFLSSSSTRAFTLLVFFRWPNWDVCNATKHKVALKRVLFQKYLVQLLNDDHGDVLQHCHNLLTIVIITVASKHSRLSNLNLIKPETKILLLHIMLSHTPST